MVGGVLNTTPTIASFFRLLLFCRLECRAEKTSGFLADTFRVGKDVGMGGGGRVRMVDALKSRRLCNTRGSSKAATFRSLLLVGFLVVETVCNKTSSVQTSLCDCHDFSLFNIWPYSCLLINLRMLSWLHMFKSMGEGGVEKTTEPCGSAQHFVPMITNQIHWGQDFLEEHISSNCCDNIEEL